MQVLGWSRSLRASAKNFSECRESGAYFTFEIVIPLATQASSEGSSSSCSSWWIFVVSFFEGGI